MKNTTQEILEVLVFVYFVVEMLIKMVALGVFGYKGSYLSNNWYKLDFILNCGVCPLKLLDIMFEIFDIHLKFCRVLSLLRLISRIPMPKAKKTRVLLKTIIKMLSQVGNICLLFTVVFFIYAVVGVELFGRLECTDDNICVGLHQNANFKHFWLALLTLYKVCTGDNWSGIMADTLRECRPNNEGYSSHLYWVSPLFFFSFVVMSQFVLVNLVVAVIIQALEDSHKNEPTNSCPPPGR
ncbi:voltage-dependent T-type calcium channel subunit alpha-1I [Etheostoma spectabile]|uniref:voltage-dependent T-type calcium channel subunit alpha-1I n=1 Tax=Etheostoma spectabile TaxID=54343 RepID=UPI0013AE99F2|nr:voltage-dependent T-type calcium channel subunit alpha-1I-like [Etheostoma spectabile]